MRALAGEHTHTDGTDFIPTTDAGGNKFVLTNMLKQKSVFPRLMSTRGKIYLKYILEFS